MNESDKESSAPAYSGELGKPPRCGHDLDLPPPPVSGAIDPSSARCTIGASAVAAFSTEIAGERMTQSVTRDVTEELNRIVDDLRRRPRGTWTAGDFVTEDLCKQLAKEDDPKVREIARLAMLNWWTNQRLAGKPAIDLDLPDVLKHPLG